jgi:hypothetical protein
VQPSDAGGTGVRTVALKADNARLCSELEQAHQALAEADSTRNSLSASRNEME